MHVGFFPSCKRKASSHLAQSVCACVSKSITCWGCFTSDLDTEIAGRSLKDFTSGRSLNQTLWVGWWTNPSSAAPAVPDSTGAVLGLAYRRIEQRSQRLQRLSVWRTDVDFKCLESAQLWYPCLSIIPVSSLVGWFVCFPMQSRNSWRYASEMSKKCVCVCLFQCKSSLQQEMSWENRLEAWNNPQGYP